MLAAVDPRRRHRDPAGRDDASSPAVGVGRAADARWTSASIDRSQRLGTRRPTRSTGAWPNATRERWRSAAMRSTRASSASTRPPAHHRGRTAGAHPPRARARRARRPDAHGGVHGPGGRGAGDPDARSIDRRDDRRAATRRTPTDRRWSCAHGRRRPTAASWLVLEDVSELRRLQRIRAEFIDNLSHELRTPLTTVSLLAETLEREAEAVGDAIPAKMRERIAKIEVETGHLVQMVNELLDLSRIESGGTLQLADGVDMGRLAADSAERLRLFAERQGVTLRSTTPPRPAAGPRRRGAARPGRRQPRPQRGQVQPRRRRGRVRTYGDGGRGRDVGRGPRDRHPARRPGTGSSSGSTRSTGRGSAPRPAAGPASGWRSPATSSSSTAAGSGSSRRRAPARRSRSPCPSRDAPERRAG